MACCSSLVAEDKPDSDQIVSLAHKFSANQIVRYKVVQHITGSRTFPGSDEPTPINAELKSVIRMRCDEIAADGTATVSIEIESGTLKIGKRQTSAFSAGSPPRKLQVTSSGKVIFPPQEQQVGDSSPDGSGLMDAGSIEPLIILANLPEQPMAVGGSWSANVVLPSQAAVKVASTLMEVKQVTSDRGAVIAQNQTTLADSASPNRQEAQSKLIFGINTGALLWAEGSIHFQRTAPDSWALDSKYTVEMLKPS